MNRADRRAQRRKEPDRFIAHCNGCPSGSIVREAGEEGDPCCEIVVISRFGKKCLGICQGCACAAGKCDRCGETGLHWIGCPIVGLPNTGPLHEAPGRRAVH